MKEFLSSVKKLADIVPVILASSNWETLVCYKLSHPDQVSEPLDWPVSPGLRLWVCLSCTLAPRRRHPGSGVVGVGVPERYSPRLRLSHGGR